MRKRLQRIRDKLRKEMEVSEQRVIRPEEIRPDFPAKVVELLARPQLTDLPENPVGKTLELLRTVYADFAERSCRRSSTSPRRGRPSATTRCTWTRWSCIASTSDRILRYDLTLPLLLTVRYEGQAAADLGGRKGVPARARSTRCTSRRFTRPRCCVSTSEGGRPMAMTGRVLQSVDRCSRAAP